MDGLLSLALNASTSSEFLLAPLVQPSAFSIISSTVNASFLSPLHRSCQTKTMEGFSLGHRALIAEAARKIALAGLACTFALSGSLIGFFSGALKGQTTETGLFRGAGIGAIAGAILAVELMKSCLQGEVLTKLAIFDSLIEGKIFREWVSPALLKAYQWQINAAEFSYRDSSDLFDIAKDKGLPPNAIKKLLTIKIILNESTEKATCCAVCLQDFVEGEDARILPSCSHLFHVVCIDTWLVKQASCPTCRHEITGLDWPN